MCNFVVKFTICSLYFPKVQWQQYVGEVDRWIIIMLQFFSVGPNIVEISRRLLKLKMWTFLLDITGHPLPLWFSQLLACVHFLELSTDGFEKQNTALITGLIR